MLRFRNALPCQILCVLVAASLVGCGDDSKRPHKTKKVSGIARKIDLKNNNVSMTFSDDKGQEVTLEGSVRDDTEVWINGRQHKLEDVREGDRVVVSGYRDKSSAEPKLIATMIEVTRPEDSDWKKPGPPAEKTGSAAPAESGSATAKRRSGEDAHQQ